MLRNKRTFWNHVDEEKGGGLTYYDVGALCTSQGNMNTVLYAK